MPLSRLTCCSLQIAVPMGFRLLLLLRLLGFRGGWTCNCRCRTLLRSGRRGCWLSQLVLLWVVVCWLLCLRPGSTPTSCVTPVIHCFPCDVSFDSSLSAFIKQARLFERRRFSKVEGAGAPQISSLSFSLLLLAVLLFGYLWCCVANCPRPCSIQFPRQTEEIPFILDPDIAITR